MIAAIGNSEYLGRRVRPILQELNGSSHPIIVGTDHPQYSGSESLPDGMVFTDREAVLANSSIPTVYIGSATGRHFEDCSAALIAGKHILVEKPVCLTSVECLELDRLARSRSRTVFECLSYPFHPAWHGFVAQILATEWVNDVTVSAVFRIPDRSPEDFRLDPRHGGAAADLGTYCLDALVRLSAAVESCGRGAVRLPESLDEAGCIMRRRVGKRTFTFTASWAIGERYTNKVVVTDGDRRIELHRAFSPPTDEPGKVVLRPSEPPCQAVFASSAPANATRACLAVGLSHLRDSKSVGLVGGSALLRRISALESAPARYPTDHYVRLSKAHQ